MPAPQQILDLIARFERDRDRYAAGQYNETELRREYLDPFFRALGWDVDNSQGYSERYKQVVHEDSIRVAGKAAAPDYAFRIGGVRKFFVEAKKPAVNLREDVSPAYQLRRYGWSAKLPLSILTDFEEFAVYDCRIRPNRDDKASQARIMYLTYKDYPARWDELIGLFSPDAIMRGAFDAYAESQKPRRGTAEVDDAFLTEMDEWRVMLARNLALRNPDLTQRQLNFAVQRTIDRIIFLRIAEARGIEPEGSLFELARGRGVYDNLRVLFEQADQKYNSGLFHFHREKGREHPDELTLNLHVDDDTLRTIISRLYYPQSPYELSVLPVDILGQVYERFLGKVIRLTAGHRARVEEKPEVRKAGGVYYTPTYIVEHIVRHTVGRLLEGRDPDSAAELRILDPACGSGSFLIGAYQYLLDWHLDWYTAHDPEKHARRRPARVYRDESGEWRLTLDEKKRILLSAIYGVDIDPQAVEVTRLSLLLKVLEGERLDEAQQMALITTERLLPDLDSNIKCGNSLIGPDYYTLNPQQMDMFDEEEMYRLNVFDWEQAFPAIMQRGGFDAVIGNPPYIRIQAMKEWAPVEVEYYKRVYHAASKGNYDVYVVFVEKGLSLLNAHGRLGYILPHKFFNAKYGQPLRELISQGNHLGEIIHFGAEQVFSGATTYTCLLFLDKAGNDEFRYVEAHDLAAWRSNGQAREGTLKAEKATAAEWNFVVGRGVELFERLSQMPVKLGDVADIFVGLQTSADSVFIFEYVRDEGELVCVKNRYGSEILLERGILKPFLKDYTVSTYAIPEVKHWLLFPYRLSSGKARLFSAEELATEYPRAWRYLNQEASILKARERGKWSHQHWYAFGRTQNLTEMDDPKLIVQVISLNGRYAFDNTGIYFTGGGNGPYYGIRYMSPQNPHSIHYLQAVLGSRVLDFYHHQISTTFRGGYWSYSKRYLEQLPIRTIDFSDPADVARHDRMVALVERMLDLHKRLNAARTPQDKEVLQRQIDATDRQIDALVYELYGLTADEIAIVEAAATR